jgi:hypothetical protein
VKFRAHDSIERRAAAQALGVDVAIMKTSAYYRRSGGRLLVCAVGANLSRGEADTAPGQSFVHPLAAWWRDRARRGAGDFLTEGPHDDRRS